MINTCYCSSIPTTYVLIKWGIVNGVNTKIEITENEFPEELKELVSKKRVLIEKKTNEINEKDREEYAQWQIEEDERYRKTIGDEEYIINRYGKELEEVTEIVKKDN